MKEALPERNVEIQGVSDAVGATIANSPKAFRALVSNGYKRKIESVTREILSNAYDAHYDANQSRPVEVTLPSTFDPYWRVRDFGISMDHTMVMENYSVMFWSNKDEDNTKVGKWGIGSKSPLSYSDSFSVTTFKDGVMRAYEIYYDNESRPVIALMSPSPDGEPTDQPDGVEVSLPVKRQDFESFYTALRRVALGLTQKPIVHGRTDFEFYPENEIQSGDGWRLMGDGWPLRGMHAKQGPVLYPLDKTTVIETNPDLADLTDENVVVEFDIGDLGITLFREDLEYDGKTRDVIARRMEQVRDDLTRELQTSIDQEATLWGAVSRYNNLCTSSRKTFMSSLIKKLTWNGESIPTYIAAEFQGVTIRDSGGNALHQGEHLWSSVHIESTRFLGVTPPRPSSMNWRWNRANVTPDDNIMVVLDDLTDGSSSRVKWVGHRLAHARSTGLFTHCILIEVWDKSLTKDDFQSLFGGIPDNQIKWARELPEIPTESQFSTTRSRQPVMFRKLECGVWKKTDVDPEEGGIYVDLHRGQITDCLGIDTHNDLVAVWKAVKTLGLVDSDAELFGVPKTYFSTPRKNAGWISLKSILKKAADGADPDSAVNYEIFDTEFSYNNDVPTVAINFRKKLTRYGNTILDRDFVTDDLDPDSPMLTLIDLIKFYESYKDDPDARSMATVMKHVGSSCEISKRVEQTRIDLRNIVREIRERYPLLKTLNSSFWATSDEHRQKYSSDVRDYVVMKDASVKTTTTTASVEAVDFQKAA